MRISKNRGIVLLALGLAFLVVGLPSAFASGPVTIVSGNDTAATASRLLCYTSGDYVSASVVIATAVISIYTSPDGVTWTSQTSPGTAKSDQYTAIACDSAGDVAAVWGISTTQFDVRLGTISGGTITWTAAAVTLSCSNHGAECMELPSIFIFDSSHVIVSGIGGGTPATGTEVWACLTSACTSSGNWASKLDDTTNPGVGGTTIVGTSDNAHWCEISNANNAGTFELGFRCTANSGSSWDSIKFSGINNGSFVAWSCATASTTTVGCSQFDFGATSEKLYYSTFVQGAGSVTDNLEHTFGSTVLNSAGATIGTDGTNIVIVFGDPTTTTLDSLTSTNGGTSFGSLVTFVSGEATQRNQPQSTMTLQGGAAGVEWYLSTSNNVRFLATPAITVPVDLTCMLKESGATTETWTASGASVSPTSGSCTPGSGSLTVLSTTPSSTVTITVQADGANTRYRFNTSATSSTTQQIATPASGTKMVTIWNYYQLQQTYQASTNGAGPPTWDTGLSAGITCTLAGVSTNVGNLLPTSGTTSTVSVSTFCDYNLSASLPTLMTGSGSNIQWQVSGTHSWTDTTGGNTHTATYYKQLQNTYQMTPVTPNTWDASYSETATGTYLGSGSSTICTVSLGSGGGAASCAGYADYKLGVSTPASFASSIAGTWTASGTHSWTDTTGGSTHNANYNLLDSVTQQVTITVANSGPTGTATISGCDATISTVPMDGTQHIFSADFSCTITYTVPADGSNTRYRFSGGTTYTHTTGASGTDTYSTTVYYQLDNTYAMSPTLPSSWDSTYSEPATGTVLGVGSSTVCSVALVSGFGLSSCTGWGDYNLAVSLPASFPSSVSGTWTATNTYSFTDTTGGNTHTTSYTLIFGTGFILTVTKGQTGSPTLTFSVTGCSASPSTVVTDGLPHTFSSAGGCLVTVTRPDSPTDRIRFTGSGTNTATFTVSPGHSYSFTYNYQIFVTVTSNDPGGATTTPSGSAWYTYGTVLPIFVTILPNSGGLPVAKFSHWAEPNASTIITNPLSVSTTAILGGGGDPIAILILVNYVVIQPNPLTAVFWIFPGIITIFFGMLFLIRAARAGATTWGRNYMLLTGIETGVLMAIVSETMPFPVLILSSIVWFLYAYRG